jgi:hypothetical protein
MTSIILLCKVSMVLHFEGDDIYEWNTSAPLRRPSCLQTPSKSVANASGFPSLPVGGGVINVAQMMMKSLFESAGICGTSRTRYPQN